MTCSGYENCCRPQEHVFKIKFENIFQPQLCKLKIHFLAVYFLLCFIDDFDLGYPRYLRQVPMLKMHVPVFLVDFNFEVVINFFSACRTYIVVFKPTVSTGHTTHMLAWHLNWILQRTFTNLAVTGAKPGAICRYTKELV